MDTRKAITLTIRNANSVTIWDGPIPEWARKRVDKLVKPHVGQTLDLKPTGNLLDSMCQRMAPIIPHEAEAGRFFAACQAGCYSGSVTVSG